MSHTQTIDPVMAGLSASQPVHQLTGEELIKLNRYNRDQLLQALIVAQSTGRVGPIEAIKDAVIENEIDYDLLTKGFDHVC